MEILTTNKKEFGHWLSLLSPTNPAKALGDDDFICFATGPTFTSISLVHKFLFGDPSSLAFADRILQANLGDGPVFRILVGAAGFLQHYLGVRAGGPNVIIKAVPSAGIADPLFELRVSTRSLSFFVDNFKVGSILGQQV